MGRWLCKDPNYNIRLKIMEALEVVMASMAYAHQAALRVPDVTDLLISTATT